MKQNDQEHQAFEKYAKSMGLDNTQHPMHLLYLDQTTAGALASFKAGYAARQKVLAEVGHHTLALAFGRTVHTHGKLTADSPDEWLMQFARNAVEEATR